jgi:hypothetical protein
MAVSGSTYAQPMPMGVVAHRKLMREIAEAAKARRSAKARKKREEREAK